MACQTFNVALPAEVAEGGGEVLELPLALVGGIREGGDA